MTGNEGVEELRPATTGVAVVESNALFRDGLRAIVNAETDLAVVADVARSGELPDIPCGLVILGVEEPGDETAVEVADILCARPAARIVVVSKVDDPHRGLALLAAGARGYLPKTVSPVHLLTIVRAVRDDGSRALLSLPTTGLHRSDPTAAPVLSERERDVLELVAVAKSNAQIAHSLGITEGTVKRHLRNIFGKLGAISRMDAVNRAVAVSLLPNRTFQEVGSTALPLVPLRGKPAGFLRGVPSSEYPPAN